MSAGEGRTQACACDAPLVIIKMGASRVPCAITDGFAAHLWVLACLSNALIADAMQRESTVLCINQLEVLV